MNNTERHQLSRILTALEAVPGVRNPMDREGHVTFYRDMSEVRIHARYILGAMLDPDPDYKEENQAKIADHLQKLEEFIALRKSHQWKLPRSGESPWYYHTTA